MTKVNISVFLSSLIIAGAVFAGPDPIKQRHELMEETRDAAKVIGAMLKQEKPFDAAAAMGALMVWKKTAEETGDLFPEGSEKGYDTEAKETIWTDRAGFEKVLAEFGEKVDAAIAAKPDSLEALKATAGPVFQSCKNCHEGYRVEKD